MNAEFPSSQPYAVSTARCFCDITLLSAQTPAPLSSHLHSSPLALALHPLLLPQCESASKAAVPKGEVTGLGALQQLKVGL